MLQIWFEYKMDIYHQYRIIELQNDVQQHFLVFAQCTAKSIQYGTKRRMHLPRIYCILYHLFGSVLSNHQSQIENIV